MKNSNTEEFNPRSYIRWWGISEGFKFNAEKLRTVKGYRNVLRCCEKLGAPGCKHTETKTAEKAIEPDMGIKGVRFLSFHTLFP